MKYIVILGDGMAEIRLQKYFTDCGVMSRRAAEEEIKAGRVTVNGHVAELGMKIDPKKDVVAFKNKRIARRFSFCRCNFVCRSSGFFW